MNRDITAASGFQAMIDVLKGATTINLANKNVGSAQNSLVDPAASTAGDYAINGVIATLAAASSSLFALEDTVVPEYNGVAFVCCLNAAGSGIGYATNVLTSAQMSTALVKNAGAACANLIVSDDIVWPTIPATMCPVGIYACVAGSVSHVSGSSSFSLITSATGSHAFTQLLNMNQVAAV